MASNSVSDVSRASTVTVPAIVTTAVAVIFTLLRLYVRRFMIRMLSWDDLFNVLAMVSTWAHPFASLLWLAEYGAVI